jgi:RES domain-containing protein
VRVWRICSRRYQRFDGEGARQYGGRWNHVGTSVVYTSGSLSLAALELFVHLDIDIVPPNLVAIQVEVPDNLAVEAVKIDSLPKNWRRYPAPEVLKDIGTAWSAKGATAILAVPSAVIPEERNYLLNPAQPDFKRIRISRPVSFRFDPRMWK